MYIELCLSLILVDIFKLFRYSLDNIFTWWIVSLTYNPNLKSRGSDLAHIS